MINWSEVKFFFKDFVQECRKKHIFILASSSSFLFFLCIIPSTLLLLSFATFTFDSVLPEETFTFLNYIESIVPDDILPTFQFLFKHSKTMLTNNSNLNTLHYIILIVSSLGFFGSVWKSVDIITEVKKHGTLLRTLYSFLSIAISFTFILLIAFIPIMTKILDILLESKYIAFLNLGRLLNVFEFELLGINFISTFFLFIFFILFFKFLLKGNTNLKSTAIGSAFFTANVVITKLLFFTYLALVKDNLVANYGSLYSLMIFVIWVFTIILALYTSIIFTFTFSRHRYNLGFGK